MLKSIFTGLYRLIWYTFAITIVSAAVLVTAVRFALPGIGGYKDEIQSWVSEYMDYPLTIDNISAEWQGWSPHLYLEKIDLYTQDSGLLISKFDSAHIDIDLIGSLAKREVVPNHLSVSGLDLEFTRNLDGSISISSDDQNRLNTNTGDNNALSEWLLKQNYIILENATLSWHDKKTSKLPIQFSDVKLELRNDESRVQINASISLPEQYGQSLQINMDITGNVLTPEWDGEIYLEAGNIEPSDLLKDLPVYSENGTADIKLWTRWQESKLYDFNAALEYKNFSLNANQHALPVNLAILNLYGERQQSKNWSVNVQVQDLETVNGAWPRSDYHFNIEKNEPGKGYKYNAYFSYLKLSEILPFVIASNALPQNITDKIQLQSIQGELTDSFISANPYISILNSFELKTQFQNLAFHNHNNSISSSNLSGAIKADNDSIEVQLDSTLSELHIASLYEKPLLLSEIKADLEFVYDEEPVLFIHEGTIISDSAAIMASGQIRVAEESPFVDLVVNLEKTNVETIPYLFPERTSKKLYTWLSKALVGGDLLSGHLIYRGNTADFPFKNSEGNFKALLNIENATLEYNEAWPPIDNLNAEVILENDDLFVSSNYGYIFDAQINEITAEVKNISSPEHHVIVNGSLSGHTNDTRLFISQSPLNSNSALTESSKNISGSLELKLGLDIPLGKEKTIINGKLTFTDATIESNLPGLGLEDVNGDINFTRQTVWAEGLDALYHSKPVTLSIPRSDQDDEDKLVITGVADKAFIINQLNSFFPALITTSNDIKNYIDGESKWELTIDSKKVSASMASKTIELNSDLTGIAIDLPYPLGKSKNEARQLKIKTKLTNSAIDKIDIDYGSNLYTDIMVDNSQDLMVKNILIGLGSRHPQDQIANNFSIKGVLDKLDLSEWIEFINLRKMLNPSSSTKKAKKSLLFDVFVNKFNLLDNDFNNVNIKLSNTDHDWQLLLDSAEIKGRAQLTNAPNDTDKQLNIDLEHIEITESQGEETKEQEKNIALKSLPEIKLNIDKTIYKEKDLGQTTLITSNIPDGINIDKLNFSKPGLTIDAKGKWLKIDDIDRSEFTATLNAESIDAMLKTFNYHSANIANGETHIELKANWMNTPMDFSMDKIDGELDMKISKGQFLDINPSAGRLFGLLSIQTLPRRLLLDFTDLFNEGFAFDSIEGNFSLQQGHAYTNDLEMTGPAADIIVSGRTGLITEDYDQVATVTPKVSNTLPVASALLGPVGIGVGAVIFLAGEIFESIPKQINKVLSYQYSITGSWDNPDIEKIKKEKQSG